MGYFLLVTYVVCLLFPGIPGNFPEKFGNSRFPGNEIVREISSPIRHIEKMHLLYRAIGNFLLRHSCIDDGKVVYEIMVKDYLSLVSMSL